jgi:hypothetical protein
MEQNLTAQSFIVRVYRVDTEDNRKITGLVESMDGSGKCEPFNDMDELAAILNRSVNRPRKKRTSRNKNETGTRIKDVSGKDEKDHYKTSDGLSRNAP